MSKGSGGAAAIKSSFKSHKKKKKQNTPAFHIPWISCLARTPSLHLSPGFRPSLARLWSDLLVVV